jgi:NTE family protein
MLYALFRTMHVAHDRKALAEDDLARIVQIPPGKLAASLDFDLSEAEREALYDSGYQAARQFLATFSLSAYQSRRTGRRG